VANETTDLGQAAKWLFAGLAVYGAGVLVLSALAQPRIGAAEGPTPNPQFGPDRVEREALTVRKATFEYECVECHDAQERDPSVREFIGEHGALNFDHGRNDRCFNCHHDTVYDALVGADGEALAHTEHVQLCARCHGPKYRDWKAGAHGRRSGFWDKSRGEQRRTDCIICHDPHRPVFAPIKPLPPPGVAVGVIHPPMRPHGAVQSLMEIPAEAAKPVHRGPAPKEDE
jgi:hypothetical protein